jgi:GMP synthase (glutamine-hydrolysing)
MANEEWISELHDFTRKALSEKVPVLGVCYGHQVLGRILGSDAVLRESPRPELGWTEIEQTAPSRLLKGLPDKFFTFSSHFQEVSQVPPGFIKTARSSLCEVQAFEHPVDPVFAIQFHPEKNANSAAKNFSVWKAKRLKSPLLGEKETAKRFNPEVSRVIFKNFVELSQ